MEKKTWMVLAETIEQRGRLRPREKQSHHGSCSEAVAEALCIFIWKGLESPDGGVRKIYTHRVEIEGPEWQ